MVSETVRATTRAPARCRIWRGKEGLGSKKKKAPGGQRKSLKRLDSEKGIQGNPSLFLGFPLLGLGLILLELAKFGFGLEKLRLPRGAVKPERPGRAPCATSLAPLCRPRCRSLTPSPASPDGQAGSRPPMLCAWRRAAYIGGRMTKAGGSG